MGHILKFGYLLYLEKAGKLAVLRGNQHPYADADASMYLCSQR